MIKELKFYKNAYGISNDITEELDKYLLKPTGDFHHYLYPIKDRETNNVELYIRYPGYTTGNIILDEDFIIKEIKFHNTLNKYNKDVFNIFDKYIGMCIVPLKSKTKI
mgnify:CR=1 FL=1